MSVIGIKYLNIYLQGEVAGGGTDTIEFLLEKGGGVLLLVLLIDKGGDGIVQGEDTGAEKNVGK